MNIAYTANTAKLDITANTTNIFYTVNTANRANIASTVHTTNTAITANAANIVNTAKKKGSNLRPLLSIILKIQKVWTLDFGEWGRKDS